MKNNKWAGICICIALFFVLLFLVKTGNAAFIDDPIRNAVFSLRADWLTVIMKSITYMGNWQTITVICLILLIIKKTRITYGVPLSIGAIFVPLINKGIKALVLRPRPDKAFFLIEQGGWSFPSGHAITTMFFYGMLIYIIRSNVKNKTLANVLTAVLAIPMLLGGISRIYLGVHYPTDVLAGWCLAIAVILLIIKINGRRRSDS